MIYLHGVYIEAGMLLSEGDHLGRSRALRLRCRLLVQLQENRHRVDIESTSKSMQSRVEMSNLM